jgi:3-dehydroquinate synthase
MMRTLDLNVARTESHSPLWVDRGVIEKLPNLIALSKYSSIVVVADGGASTVRERVCTALSIPPSRVKTLKGGESQKEVTELVSLWEFFVEQKLDRKSLVVTIGGGATSDLVGFAAGTYMRGIAFLHIPSTLLAQVDASIGGKAGINFQGVKNLIGSIAQPVGIVIDIDALTTLPERELRSGFAEVVKHGLIADREYFDKVSSRDCGHWTADEMVEIVYRSCEIKKAVVESDETEQGPRKNLNFGHSIGHAIEAFSLAHGPALTHGEAISIGMYGEAYISHRIGKISAADLTTIDAGLTTAGLPARLPFAIPAAELRALISKDKKNVGGQVKWTLLERIGSALFDIVVPEELIVETLSAIQPGATHT